MRLDLGVRDEGHTLGAEQREEDDLLHAGCAADVHEGIDVTLRVGDRRWAHQEDALDATHGLREGGALVEVKRRDLGAYGIAVASG